MLIHAHSGSRLWVRLMPLLAVVLCACGGSPAPNTDGTTAPDPAARLQSLMLPKAAHGPILKIELRRAVVDTPFDSAAADARARQAFHDTGLLGAASYKYTLKAGATPRRYGVRLSLFRDPTAALAGWARRFPPEEQAMGRAVEFGEAGLAVGTALRAFRWQDVIVEIEGGADAEQIDAFAEAWADHVRRVATSGD